MRAFIAIEASQEVRDAVTVLVAELESRMRGARWIPPQNLHLTLRFLGNIEGEAAAAISDELRSLAARYAPFRVELRGIGLFPSPRRPRVLGALIPQPPRELLLLQRQLEDMVVEQGFPPEERAFAPHLTFARFRKPGGDLRRIQSELDSRALGFLSVDEVIFFESALKRSGAVYHARARLPLSGAGRS